jgi:hypothetical protein
VTFRGLALREGRPSDAPAMVALRDALRLTVTPTDGPTREVRGGFLLGCTASEYRSHAAAGRVVVLVRGGTLLGFAVVLCDAALRRSALWARRAQIAWMEGEDADRYLSARLAYFDQLAVEAGASSRLGAPGLALLGAQRALLDHDHLFATTVEEPVLNRAALPLLRRVGGRRVAEVREDHPAIGPFRSGVYALDRETLATRLQHLSRSGTRAERAVLRFASRTGGGPI